MNWLTEIEKHVSFGFILAVCGVFLKNHKLVIKVKERLNDLWWDRCADLQEPYIPIENGTSPVVPQPRTEPRWRT